VHFALLLPFGAAIYLIYLCNIRNIWHLVCWLVRVCVCKLPILTCGSEMTNIVFILQVDTMIIQAIGLLDDLDKELNTYAMRVREWYGWHFLELTKIVTDNIQYAKVVKMMGNRANAVNLDFSEVSY
jgi:hypothetical protein